MTDSPEGLSPAGVERREAILRLTLHAVRQRRRRRAIRGAAGAAVLVLMVVLLRNSWQRADMLSWREDSMGVAMNRNTETTPERGPSEAGPHVEVIPPDPTICTRLAAPERPATWRTIDDDELLAALEDAGQRAGLVEINGQAMLFAKR